MLYKPSSVSPHMEAVDKDNLIFSCDTMSSSVVRARLMVSDGRTEYFFDVPSGNIISDGGMINVSRKLINGESASNAIRISRDTDGYIRNLLTDKKLSLNNNMNYMWQMRLYEESIAMNYTPSSWIGWGIVDELRYIYESGGSSANTRSYSTDPSKGAQKYLLRIRPHTNINSPTLQGSYIQNDLSLYRYYEDANAKYYIRTNSGIAPIEAFYWYNPTQTFNKATDCDGYGTPIYGYAVISADKNIGLNNVGDEYTLLCNYIDSDTYYFETKQTPKLTLYQSFTDIRGNEQKLSITSDDLEINYSKLRVKGEYSQADGASVVSYSFSLYEGTDVIDSTGEIFASSISYTYDRFINGHIYILKYFVTDTNNIVTEGEFVVTVKYQTETQPVNLQTTYFKDHNSIIVDFSSFISIDSEEKEPGAHSFKRTNADTGKETNTEEATDNISTACHINKGNHLTFNNDLSSELSFGEYTAYALFSVDSGNTGVIFRIANSTIPNRLCTLFWDGTSFLIIGDGNTTLRFSPYQSWLNMQEKERKTAIAEAMSDTNENYSVPFLYYDDLPYSDNLYFHEESIVSDHAWLVIIDIYEQSVWFKDMNGTIEGKAGAA